MSLWIILGIIAVIIFVAIALFSGGESKKLEYQYKKREYLMTQSERKCFETLMVAVGDKYHIFPQIHLPNILDHKVVGQNWNGAFRHIDEKSVDFVLCDKANLTLKLAIELDDRSHERTDRQLRDREVERIFNNATMPLLRIKYPDTLAPIQLSQKVDAILNRTI